MADPAGTHSDGSLLWGTQVLAIPTTSGSNYIANDIKVDFDSKSIESMNESGVVNKEVLIEQPFTGTATLQLSGSTIPTPAIGAAFTITSLNSVSLSCKVTKSGLAYKQDGETLVDISFKKKLN